MLFSELYKIIVDKVTFVGLRGRSPPLYPPLELSFSCPIELRR